MSIDREKRYTQTEVSREGAISLIQGLITGGLLTGVALSAFGGPRPSLPLEDTILNFQEKSIQKISDRVYESRDRNLFGVNEDSDLREGESNNFEIGCQVVGTVEIQGDKYILLVKDSICSSKIR